MLLHSLWHTQRRLAVALGLSMLVHAWLMESDYGKGSAMRGDAVTRLSAQLLPAGGEAGPPGLEASAPRAGVSEMPMAVGAEVRPAPPVSAVSVRTRNADSAAVSTSPPAAIPQPSDPTYYAAGDLDVFPRALVKPDLGAALVGVHRDPSAGTVRAMVLIDEAGAVNAVRDVQAPANDVETVARDLLLRTRFTPARDREGRIVKAQVLVALEYDSRATASPR